MIGQITPLVKVAGRRDWLAAVAAHIAGCSLSASVLGMVLGTVGLIAGLGRQVAISELLVSAIFAGCALRDAGLVRWRLPSLQRQTPKWALCVYGRRWGAFAWGIDLGQGWTTRCLLSGYYALVLWAVLNGSPAQGAMVLASYGMGRGLPVWMMGMFADRCDVGALARWHGRRLPIIQQVDAAVLAFAAGLLLVAT